MNEIPQPTTPEIESLRCCLSPEAFARRVKEAQRKVAVVEELKQVCPGAGGPSRSAVRQVVPRCDRTNVLRWWRQYAERPGEPWERLFSRRRPAELWEVPEAWRQMVLGLGYQEPPPTWKQMQTALVRRHGEGARLCENTIRKILRSEGLAPGQQPISGPAEEVEELFGGGLLVLVLAAALETGAITEMATALVQLARSQVPPEWPIEQEPAGRDELGRLTADYNRSVVAMLRAQSPPRTVFQSTDEAVVGRDPTRLRVVHLSELALARHLSALVALPLVTQRRGTAGLQDPGGAWLAVVAGQDYQPATLEKTLNGLKVLAAGAVLWECHARTWQRVTACWLEGEPPWRQLVAYIDGSKDPWWTDHFARSGKVERTGRVQPCLERTVLATGAGVPLLAEVVSGNDDLSEASVRMLTRCDATIGKGLVGRLTVVDAACCELGLLRRFAADPDRDVITVLKGSLARGKVVEARGEWQPYRQRDQVREASVELAPGQTDGLRLRAVELVRRNSRHPHTTVFLSTAAEAVLSTTEVADAYLSRWVGIENHFRVGRAGLGWERTDGFGVSRVTHFAVLEKRQAAARKLRTAAQANAKATDAEARATLQLSAAEDRVAERQANSPDPFDGRNLLGVRQGKRRLDLRRKEARAARKRQDEAVAEVRRLDSMPTEIYVRDTRLDTITSCLKMVLLCLLEFVCREYLEGRALQPRTLCAAWLHLPVTVRTGWGHKLYEVTPNPRDPKKTELLRRALAEITRRCLCDAQGRLVVARLRGEGDGSEPWRDP